MKDKTTEKVRKPRVRFCVDKKGRFVHDAVLFMMLSIVFRVVGCWGLWTDRFFLITQILLPIASSLLFILILRFLGDKAFPATILPMLMGVAFFIIKAFTFESALHTALCIALYVLVAVLYTATALGYIRTKWFLVPLFALPFLYHVFVEDLAALRDVENPVLFSDGMQELSVLCVMIALIFTALALKKRKPPLEESNLPKIKDPVVIKPNKPAIAAAGPAVTANASAAAAAPAAPASAEAAPAPKPDKPEETKPESEAGKEETQPAAENTAAAENKEEDNSSNTES